MSGQIQLPQYQCHKKVWALKIKDVVNLAGDAPEANGTELHFENERYSPIVVDAAFVAKHNPAAGMYLVVYEDGYRSVSPAKAFEDGYTLIGGNQ